jgi:hypothetical protein
MRRRLVVGTAIMPLLPRGRSEVRKALLSVDSSVNVAVACTMISGDRNLNAERAECDTKRPCGRQFGIDEMTIP